MTCFRGLNLEIPFNGFYSQTSITSVTENVEQLCVWETNVVNSEENGEVIRQGSLSMLTYNTAFAWGLIPQCVDLVLESTHREVAFTVVNVKIIMHDSDLSYRNSEDKISLDSVN
jgi:hypothetical protein